jgi:hypothetical protein
VLYLGLIKAALFVLTDCSPQGTFVSQSQAGEFPKAIAAATRELAAEKCEKGFRNLKESWGGAVA